MIIARRIGAIVLAIAAATIWFFMAPAEPKAPVFHAQQPVGDQSAAINRALSEYEQNNVLATGAPQQAVVNGWVAKDLLSIIAKQQNEALTRPAVAPSVPPATPNDERIPALVGLLVLGLALTSATATQPGSVAAIPPPDRGDGVALQPGVVQP